MDNPTCDHAEYRESCDCCRWRALSKDTIKSLAKEMGDAGYCNYAACEEFLVRCFNVSAVPLIRALREILDNEPLTALSSQERHRLIDDAERAIEIARQVRYL